VMKNLSEKVATLKEQFETAMLVNETGAAHLAKACAAYQAVLIHLSTDYIFNPTEALPIDEDLPPDPVNKYGISKYKGEEAIRRATAKHVILRTSWLYSTHGHNFFKTMLRLSATRDTLSIVYDQVGTPTYAGDLARAIMHVIAQIGQHPNNAELLGTFNYSHEGICSWYDFAVAIFELESKNVRVHPIRTEQYPLPAKRPAYSVLDKTKFKNTYNLSVPHWREGLMACIKKNIV